MAESTPKLILHCTNGEPLEVRADEIVCVQGVKGKAADCGARIMLSRTDEEGHNVQLAVCESAEVIAAQLAKTERASQWQGA